MEVIAWILVFKFWFYGNLEAEEVEWERKKRDHKDKKYLNVDLIFILLLNLFYLINIEGQINKKEI